MMINPPLLFWRLDQDAEGEVDDEMKKKMAVKMKKNKN